MLDYTVVTKSEDLGSVANAVDQAQVVGLDLETTALSPHHGRIRLLSLNTGNARYVVDLFQTGGLGPIGEALQKSKGIKVGQNLKFDQKFLMHEYGVELWPVFDTFRASNVIYNGKPVAHDLYSLYTRELQVEHGTADMGASDWSGPLTTEQLRYAAEDVTYLLRLRDVLRAALIEDGLARAALLEFEAIVPEASIELNGFRLDSNRWLELYEKNKAQAKKLREELLAELPSPSDTLTLPGIQAGWNLASPPQKLQSLRKLGVNIDSTREIVLAMHAAKFPVIKKLIDFNHINKRVTAFGPGYLKHLDPATGRIHTSFYPYTGTGRYASSGPNLQQIPRSRDFRDCFAVLPGRVLVGADWSQVELRMAARLSKDPVLMDVYKQGLDAHIKTASLVNDVAMDAVTKAMRQLAKPINFGLIYGLGAEKLVQYAQMAYGVAMTLDEAQLFRRKYFEGYAGVRGWHERALACKSQGFVRTLSGRIRYLGPEAHNEYINTGDQGSCADGLKAALVCVYRRLKKYGGRVKMVHMVHDEIILEADDTDEKAAIQRDLEDGMVEGIQPFLDPVPAVAEGSCGLSWGAIH